MLSKEQLKELGWSPELIEAAVVVAGQVRDATRVPRVKDHTCPPGDHGVAGRVTVGVRRTSEKQFVLEAPSTPPGRRTW